MGHEFSGTIEEVGQDVKGWKIGDRVVVEPVISCSSCYSCKQDRPNVCHSLGFIGISGWGGGLSEFICVEANELLHALPNNVSLQDGAMVEPLAVAMHAVQASNLSAGDTALVVGAGPIGCFVIKTLLSQGASMIIVSEPSSLRRETARMAGAHHVFNPIESDIIAECHKLTGGKDVGVAVSFECAGVQKALDQALGALRTKGTCVICYQNNHKTAIQNLSDGTIKLDGFVTAKIALKDVVKLGFEELLNHNERHVKILVSPNGGELAEATAEPRSRL
ncbi:hypothetical protein RQP46_005259 [Phenoliferia psychrophenolica]